MTASRKRVVLESPYKGTDGNYPENRKYARRAVMDSLMRQEAPIASHLLYTQPGILQDDIETQRQWGIEAGHRWISVAEGVVFYCDRGMSAGMRDAEKIAKSLSVPVEYRWIDKVVYDPIAERATLDPVS